MQCPSCDVENAEGTKFCIECGVPLQARCPQCGSEHLPRARFCGECGTPLPSSSLAVLPAALVPRSQPPLSYTPRHLAEKILTSRSALEGERKPVTVLFCDLANSTALAERLGPEAMHTLLNRFFQLSLAEIHRYEGTINQFLGDGFMALFGAPIAVEDHARRAVLAAVGLQRMLRRDTGGLGEDAEAWPAEGRPTGNPVLSELQVRMGLNTGLVVVGSIGDNLRMDYTAVGDTTNLAARLQQLAEPGIILLSAATARLAQGYVRVAALAPAQVKGKAEPITAYQVLGLGPRRSPLEPLGERTLSQYVGRARELEALHELLAQVERGQGQVVGMVGEAGLGKSRLLYEFRQSCTAQRVTYLEGRCLSYGSAIPYLPIMDVLRNNCGITDADSPDAVAVKVRIGLQEVGMDPEEGAPYLLQLLGVKAGTAGLAVLSPEAIKARTFETLRQMSLKGSQRRPLIFEVEDLHWIDKTSEEFFASLVESLAGAPIFLLCTYRPGYRPPWLEKSYATQLALRPLSPQDSLSVVHSVLQTVQVPDPLAQVILSKAEGNPFFLEELSRAITEHGDLRPTLAVPNTVQGVLMARIDRLPDPPKRLLQTASVLGREVPLKLLGGIWAGPGAMDLHLLELKRLEFLYERTGAEEPVYVFKHALTQEVAYESLLTPRRQALHAAAGRTLETLYADRLEEVYDRLAYHYARTEEAARAVEYLTRSAEKAARSYAHVEAVTALQEALVHVERLPAEERERPILDLTLRQAFSLYFLGRWAESVDLLVRQRQRLERLQDASRSGPYHFWLAHMYSRLGEQQRAAQSAQQAVEAATQCADEATMGKAYGVLALEGYWSGQSLQGIEHGRRSVSLLERTEERWWLGMTHFYVGLNYLTIGRFDLALEAEARCHTIGETIGDPRLQSYAAWITGWVYALTGEWEAGIQVSQQSLKLAPDLVSAAYASAFLGYAYLEKGDGVRAIPLLAQAVQQLSQFGFRQFQGWLTTLLGEPYLLNGELEKARDLVIRGMDIARDARFWYGVGWGQRVLGRIAQASGALSEATAHLNEALGTFIPIQARFEVGRTHLDLAALAHAEGDREAVSRHLREAHDLFRALQVPRYVERTAQLASAYAVRLSAGST